MVVVGKHVYVCWLIVVICCACAYCWERFPHVVVGKSNHLQCCLLTYVNVCSILLHVACLHLCLFQSLRITLHLCTINVLSLFLHFCFAYLGMVVVCQGMYFPRNHFMCLLVVV